MEAWIIVLVGFALLLAGVPLVFVFGLLAAGIFYAGGTSLSIIISTVFSGMESFVLLAIPLFILAGMLMEEVGLTDELLEFCKVLVGRMRGGLAMITIVGEMFLSGITGTATGDAAALSSVLLPTMEKEGYPKDFSCAVIAAASTMGPIIPPSIIMVVAGVVNDVSIGGLFAAGLLPGILTGLSLMVVSYYYARKYKLPKYNFPLNLQIFFSALLKGTPGLIMIVIILGGILGGIFTPTEASAIAVFYAFIFGMVKRRLNPSNLYSTIIKSARISAMVMLIIGTANSFAYALSLNLIPQKVSASILKMASTPFSYLLVTNLVLLVAGCVLESAAIIVILSPILMKGAIGLGIHPLHFAFIMVMNLCIGLITPPVGLSLYVVSSIGKVSIEKISRAALLYIAALVGLLVLFTYWANLTLFVPKLLGFA